MNNMMLKDCSIDIGGDHSYDVDIDADDIDVEDTVTVIWEIR